MQETTVVAWPEPQLSRAKLHSLRDLNRRFLELVSRSCGVSFCEGEFSAGLALRLAPMSRTQREAAADCPYALFDLRFRDAPYWRQRLREGDQYQVADEPGPDAATVEFVRLALFYAWHIVSMPGFSAQLLLGMCSDTAAAFRETTVENLSSIAASETAHLKPRWIDCAVYWSALVGAACEGDPAVLRRIQLHGLQLAAASRLPSI